MRTFIVVQCPGNCLEDLEDKDETIPMRRDEKKLYSFIAATRQGRKEHFEVIQVFHLAFGKL